MTAGFAGWLWGYEAMTEGETNRGRFSEFRIPNSEFIPSNRL